MEIRTATLDDIELRTLRSQGTHFVFVPGDPNYYQRYEFTPEHQVQTPYPLSYPEAWMAITLQEHCLDEISGQVVCAESL